jgi:type IV pilus assembly protein PilP
VKPLSNARRAGRSAWTRTLMLGAALALVPLAAVSAGCGDDPKPPPPKKAAPVGAAPAGANQPGADAGPGPSPTADMPPLPKRDFQERDFAESDSNRDPFRSFAADLIALGKTRISIQRKVLVDRYALEELKLVGLVQGSPSRALLIDPTGLGWDAKVGDFVGKPEMVHSGGPTGTDVPINWRVDRIRPSDVVFIREDPSHPEIPPTTRVIALRALEEVTTKGEGITAASTTPQ